MGEAAGLMLLGLLAALAAIVLGCISLGGIYSSRRRGLASALTGLFLGIIDVIGWLVIMCVAFRGDALSPVVLADFETDETAIEALPPAIGGAMKANVVIEAKSDWGVLGSSGLGSGVIVGMENGQAIIVTNRHVVDSKFAADHGNANGKPEDAGPIEVKLFGKAPRPGTVLWIAPDGIDLALVGVPAMKDEVHATQWRPDTKLTVGEDVFAIGNPCGLAWTHTPGVISQLRLQRLGGRKVRIIQTNAAINPGNSGGGLYNENGMLIGINTWTNDKRVSEGLSFAIAWESLLKLNPPHLNRHAPSKPPAEDQKRQP
jgi:serine protease Do